MQGVPLSVKSSAPQVGRVKATLQASAAVASHERADSLACDEWIGAGVGRALQVLASQCGNLV